MEACQESGTLRFHPASIGFSIIVMPTLRVCDRNGYEKMPPIEEALKSFLKAPSLPSKPLQDISCLNGRAYAVAGQPAVSLHTMAVLQAYKADLLKDLDRGQG